MLFSVHLAQQVARIQGSRDKAREASEGREGAERAHEEQVCGLEQWLAGEAAHAARGEAGVEDGDGSAATGGKRSPRMYLFTLGDVIRADLCAWLQANFSAQGKLLAQAENKVFHLETARKETQHKIDRLRDYERQIEQLTATQKLWYVQLHL